MGIIIDGILNRKLPWGLVLIGILIALTLELAGVASLPFAVGVYLPIQVSVPIFIGGVVRWLADKLSRRAAEEAEMSPGVLLSSGYIAGGAIGGVVIAFFAFAPASWITAIDLSRVLPAAWNDSNWPSVLAFSVLAILLLLVGWRKAFLDSKFDSESGKHQMKATPVVRRLIAGCLSLGSLCAMTLGTMSLDTTVHADEGMWLFNQPPTKLLKDKYGFEPTAAWLEHLQKSAVRFNSGGSGSFVSPRRPGDDQPPRRRRRPAEAAHGDKDYLKPGFLRQNARRRDQVRRPGAERPGEHRGRDRAGERRGEARTWTPRPPSRPAARS